MKRTFIRSFFLAALLLAPRVAGAAVDFTEISGSDLGLGVGARAVSMGGAFTALADDASAIYWNPAGLTLLPKSEFSIMANTAPTRFSFKTLILRPKSWVRNRYSPAVAYSQINRLKYIGDGYWGDGNASHLVDLSMIYMPDVKTYTGGINSRTVDHRLTVAARLPKSPISMGINFIDFKCTTTFFNSPLPRKCQTVAYKTADIGFLYQSPDNTSHRYGFTLRNPLETSKPKYMDFGVVRFEKGYTYTFDIERIYGHYGNTGKTARFLFLRGGYERKLRGPFTGRFGLILPVIAKTSSLGNIRKDIPGIGLGGTLGLGYTRGDSTLDLAVFGDPGRSFVEKKISIGTSMSLTQKF